MDENMIYDLNKPAKDIELYVFSTFLSQLLSFAATHQFTFVLPSRIKQFRSQADVKLSISSWYFFQSQFSYVLRVFFYRAG